MKNVGLTGGLGSGKSTALNVFYELGANVLDADDIAKNLLQSDQTLIMKVKEIFGRDCYYNNKLQTSVLAERAFRSREKQEYLHGLVYPLLRKQLSKYLAACTSLQGVLMVEAALLFEAGFEDIFDITILVTAEKGIRLERTRSRRAQNEADIRKRMALQMPETEKRKRADYIIENNGDIQQLRKACTALWGKIITA